MVTNYKNLIYNYFLYDFFLLLCVLELKGTPINVHDKR